MEDIQQIKVTKDMLNELLKHKKRTALGPYAITKGRIESKPDGLDGKVLSNILTGSIKTIPKNHFDYIIKRYKTAPDKPKKLLKRSDLPTREPYQFKSAEISSPYIGARNTSSRSDHIVIPLQILEEFREYRDSGLSPSRVLDIIQDKPEGFSTELANSWISGQIKSASPQFLEFYLDACRQASNHPQRYIVITDELIDVILGHRERTGRSGIALLKDRNDIPEGLHAYIINSWISKDTNSARKDYVEYTINLWIAMPDKIVSKPIKKAFAIKPPKVKKRLLFGEEPPEVEKLKPKKPIPTKKLIVINDEMRKELEVIYDKSVDINIHSKPRGLRMTMVEGWTDGRIKTARKDHWDFILKLYKK